MNAYLPECKVGQRMELGGTECNVEATDKSWCPSSPCYAVSHEVSHVDLEFLSLADIRLGTSHEVSHMDSVPLSIVEHHWSRPCHVSLISFCRQEYNLILSWSIFGRITYM